MEDFYKYLAPGQSDKQWGIYLTVAGKATILPYTDYPQEGHPTGYYFTWERGRVLDEYQFVFILSGKGVMETKKSQYRIRPGTIMIIRPGEYHRYKPDLRDGWHEYFIGFSGILVNHFYLQNQVFINEDIIVTSTVQPIASIFDEIFQQVHKELPGFQQIISGLILQLFGQLIADKMNVDFSGKPIADSIQKARIYIRGHVEEHIDLKALAHQYHISYASFRKQFKKYTGMAPRQYHMELKIRRAKELLLTTDLTISEIADQLQFESVHYFSRYFRKKTDLSPSSFKRQRL